VKLADLDGKNTVSETNQPGYRGYNKKPTFPKFNVSARMSGESFCILDGQTFNRHSKKNMMRHIFVIQNSFIESQKEQSDLRLIIGKYEKKYGKLKEEKVNNKNKPKKKVE